MTAFDEIERARAVRLTTKRGKAVTLRPLPPLSEAEIANVERGAGIALPTELKELLRSCGGLEGLDENVDFSGRRASFEYSDVFPHALGIAADDCGNYWVLDLTSETAERARVYYACHDPPVIAFQSPDLAHFVRELLQIYVPPHRSAVDDVHEKALLEDTVAINRQRALRSSDLELRTFAEDLDDRFSIVDLRDPRVGVGFEWGIAGPRTIVRRHGDRPLFAYAVSEPRPFWKLFSGRK
jgi:hypothetical protein